MQNEAIRRPIMVTQYALEDSYADERESGKKFAKVARKPPGVTCFVTSRESP